MKIELQKITVGDIAKGYVDNEEEGVRGYDGKLDIRPPYQREFIYKEKERDAVITTIKSNFPLNVMYWAKNDDGTFEIIDGQQRTISFCQYVNGDFAYDFQYFHNLTNEEKEDILNYELMVYICEGTDKEKLDWFRVINIAGAKLTEQELRNAVYTGPFVSDAKRHFSKNNCPAYNLGKNLINGSPIRQEFLETAIKWIANAQKLKNVEQYMAAHQHDPNANQLWQYYVSVITWVTSTFNEKTRKSIMKGIDWGTLYEKYHNEVLDKSKIDKEIGELLKDSEVQNKRGICPYVLTRDESCLGLRLFGQDIKEAVYAKQNGICPDCGNPFDFDEMEADHIIPWSKGGKTVEENCRMLCRKCNRKKSNK